MPTVRMQSGMHCTCRPEQTCSVSRAFIVLQLTLMSGKMWKSSSHQTLLSSLNLKGSKPQQTKMNGKMCDVNVLIHVLLLASGVQVHIVIYRTSVHAFLTICCYSSRCNFLVRKPPAESSHLLHPPKLITHNSPSLSIKTSYLMMGQCTNHGPTAGKTNNPTRDRNKATVWEKEQHTMIVKRRKQNMQQAVQAQQGRAVHSESKRAKLTRIVRSCGTVVAGCKDTKLAGVLHKIKH